MTSEQEIPSGETVTYAILQSAQETQRHASNDPRPNSDYVLKYESVTPELRIQQRDTFDEKDAEELATKGNIYVVADGSKRQDGPFASRKATQYVIEHYLNFGAQNPWETLREALQAGTFGAAVACAVIRGMEGYIANLGNCRAYLLREGNIERIGSDNPFHLEEDEDVPLEGAIHGPISLQKGDAILLSTDGLWQRGTGINEQVVSQRIYSSRNPAEACHRLVTEALDGGGSDDISVSLVKVSDFSTFQK